MLDFPVSLGTDGGVKVTEINLVTVREATALTSAVIESRGNGRIAEWSIKNIAEGKGFEFTW